MAEQGKKEFICSVCDERYSLIKTKKCPTCSDGLLKTTLFNNQAVVISKNLDALPVEQNISLILV